MDHKQNNISAEEMMRRLTHDSGNGESVIKSREVITRADGTKVVRVHKKRRVASKEAFRKNKSKHIIIYGLIAIFCFFFVLMGVGSYAMYRVGHFSSESYLEEYAHRLADELGADSVNVHKIVVTPNSLGIDSLDIIFPKGNVVQKVALQGVEANISMISLFLNRWKGESVFVNTAQVTLNLKESESANTSVELSPRAFMRFNRFRVQNMAVDIVSGDKKLFSGKNLQVHVTVQNDKSFAVNVEQGNVTIPTICSGACRASARIEENGMPYCSLSVSDGDNVDGLTLSTEYTKGMSLGKLFTVSSDSVRLSGMTGGRVSNLLNGEVKVSKGYLGFNLKDDVPTLNVEGTITAPEIKGFSFMGVISQMYSSTDYQSKLRFKSEQRFALKCDKNGLHFDNIEFSDPRLMSLNGNIDVSSQGELSGNLEIGIPEVLALRDEVTKVHPLYKSREGGYFWFNTVLSGTVKKPADDSIQQFEAAEKIRLKRRTEELKNQQTLPQSSTQKERSTLLKEDASSKEEADFLQLTQ